MKKTATWILVRERCISKTKDWKACATYVKEFLCDNGDWAIATNRPRIFTKTEAKNSSPRPYGEYFERAK